MSIQSPAMMATSSVSTVYFSVVLLSVIAVYFLQPARAASPCYGNSTDRKSLTLCMGLGGYSSTPCIELYEHTHNAINLWNCELFWSILVSQVAVCFKQWSQWLWVHLCHLWSIALLSRAVLLLAIVFIGTHLCFCRSIIQSLFSFCCSEQSCWELHFWFVYWNNLTPPAAQKRAVMNTSRLAMLLQLPAPDYKPMKFPQFV